MGLVHCPFSVFYHLTCASFYGKVHPVEENFALRLDLIFIHMGASLIALATSGNYEWFAVNLIFNSFCSYRRAGWHGSGMERRSTRFLAAMGYILPVWMLDVELFLHALFAFFIVVVAFLLNRQMQGWGHTISHLLLMPLTSCLFKVSYHVTF